MKVMTNIQTRNANVIQASIDFIRNRDSGGDKRDGSRFIIIYDVLKKNKTGKITTDKRSIRIFKEWEPFFDIIRLIETIFIIILFQ